MPPPLGGEATPPVPAEGTLREQEQAARIRSQEEERERKAAIVTEINQTRQLFLDRAMGVYEAIKNPSFEGYTVVTVIPSGGVETVYTQPVVGWFELGTDNNVSGVGRGTILCDGAIHDLNKLSSAPNRPQVFSMDALSHPAGKGQKRYPLMPGIDQDPAVSNERSGDALPVQADGGEDVSPIRLKDGTMMHVRYYSKNPTTEGWSEENLREHAEALKATLNRGKQLVTGKPLPSSTPPTQ